MTRVLVIGAAGCLGRALTKSLAEAGHNVVGLDPRPAPSLDPNIEHIQGRSSDQSTLKQALDSVDAVVNLVAVQPAARESARTYYEVNVDLLQMLLDACVRNDVPHLVHLSSSIVYGLPIGRPFREDDERRPLGAYAASKVEGERRVAQAKRRGLFVTTVRPRLLMGPGRLGVFERLFDHVKKGLPVPMIGRGKNRFQMTAVEDAATFIRLAIEKHEDGVFNIGSDDTPPMRALLRGLIAHAGSSSVLIPTPARVMRRGLSLLDAVGLSPLGPEHYRFADLDFVLDTQKAKSRLGWRPTTGDLAALCAAYDDYVSPSRSD